MSSDDTFDIEKNYKKYYGPIFSFFYLIEGIHQAIPPILPYYLLLVFGEYNIAFMAMILFTSTLPWSFKMIVGLINDKWGSDRWGRRFPFVLVFGSLAGVTWIIMTFTLPLDQTIYYYIIAYVIITNIGMAFADTSLDGLILDVTPKDKLAKVQGYTWTMLMVGGAGAAAIGLIFYWFGIVPLLFLITGITMIISCILVYYIKEPPLKEEIHVTEDLKRLVKEGKNWKVFSWTLVTAMVYPIIIATFFYLMLITMGIVDVSEAILSLQSGQTTDAFIIWSIVANGTLGIGIIVGSLIFGRLADKKRKRSMFLIYSIYIPSILVSSVFFGVVLGIMGHIIFGLAYGAITVVGQTIRGDIAKRNFPDTKSTYYALLISFSNLGQAFGSLILAFIFSTISQIITNFFMLYFIVTLVCTVIMIGSFLIFRTIDSEDYEFGEDN